MDPLSIAASIAGLLSAAGQVARFLGPYASAVKDTPQIAARVHAEVKAISIIFSALQGLTQNLASIPAQRAGLIRVDQIVTILTDGVLLFSELEEAVQSLPAQKSAGQRLGLRGRQQWARKGAALAAFLTRLEGFKSSASLILTILNSESDRLAAEQQQQLSININDLLERNLALSRRLMTLEDTFDVQSLVSKRQSVVSVITNSMARTNLHDSHPAASAPPDVSEVGENSRFENDLEASWVYRRAKRGSMDFSFRSSVVCTDAWSVFSGLSLNDVSVLSVIALPIYQDELSNAGYYNFGKKPPPPVPTTSMARKGPILYQCLEIRLQLIQIPGFPELCREGSIQPDDFYALLVIFRKGFPFLMLLRALGHPQGERLLSLPGYRPARDVEVFLKACSEDLEVGQGNLLTESKLFQNDLVEFLKVLSLVSWILDRLVKFGTMVALDLKTVLPSADTADLGESRTHIEKFLADERSYVSQLETLAAIDTWIEINAVEVPAEICAAMKQLEVRLLANFHIQMLVLMERNLFNRPGLQCWEKVFSVYSDNANREGGFIFDEERARRRIRAFIDSKQHENQELESKLAQLLQLLPLGATRVSIYQSLLILLNDQKAIVPAAQLDDLRRADLHLQQAAVKIKYKMAEAESDMFRRVVADWQGHSPETFGKLVLFDDVNISGGNSWPLTRLRVYIFDRALVCCEQAWLLSTDAAVKEERRLVLKHVIPSSNIIKVYTSVVLFASFAYQVLVTWWGHGVSGDKLPVSMIFNLPSRSQASLWAWKLGAMAAANQSVR